MCITSTSRRRALNFKLLPTHLLKQPQQQPSTQSNDACQNVYMSTVSMLKAAPRHQDNESVDHPNSGEHGAKGQVVVRHDYHDHSTDPVVDPTQIKHKAKGGVVIPFPVKLHSMLDAIERDGYAHIVSWQPHGRCFVVHKPKEFVSHIMPKYFKQSKMASFQRQLNLYGFNRLTSGLDKGGYYHELFLRGKVSLAYDINRMRVKGTGVRMPTNPDSEPNLYGLPPIPLDGAMPADAPSSQEVKTSPPEPFNLEKRRAELEMESRAHTKKIEAAAAAVAADFAPPLDSMKEEDLVFFEGCPFHYLDPNALAPAPRASFVMPPALPSLSEASRPAFAKLPSTVSESESSSDDEDILPAFSAQSMDWEGPLTNIDKGSMNLKIKSSYEDDIEQFFNGFELEQYHDEIERMSDDDDTAFGYLLEKAISE
ncbi:hypothetical protein ACHAXN_013102 [Cyclotella atomus]